MRFGLKRCGLALLWIVLGFVLVLVGITFVVGLLLLPIAIVGRIFFPLSPLGWLLGFLFLFIIFGIFRIIFWPWRWGHRYRHWGGYDDAYRILRERYARGDITKEQFEQIASDLEKHR